MTGTSSTPNYYAASIPDDFRQGDIFRDVLHLMLSEPGWIAVREQDAKGGRKQLLAHTPVSPPKGGFRVEKEKVIAEGQLGMAVVLSHDCEIENDTRSHRLVGLVRPLQALQQSDQDVIVSGQHFGRLYLPAWPSVGLPESYLDFRRITTLREDALRPDDRIASMSDGGRRILQVAFIRYVTELYRAHPEQLG